MKHGHHKQKVPPEGVDAEIGNRLIATKAGVAALRSVRVGLMQLAYALAARPDASGFLLLPDVSITRSRLQEEWGLASSAFRPELMNRLSICIGEGDHFVGIPKNPDTETQRIISRWITSQGSRAGSHLPRADYSFLVLELLIHRWLCNEGPMTTAWLMKTAGCSYQTVAGILRRLDHCLVRHSDRRVELVKFPKEEWARLVAVSEKARSPIRFADRSGQPRSSESILRRLQRLGRQDIALGGVMGAMHYLPRLDLMGNPRLDLSVHCPGKAADLSFIERLDPALARVDRRDDPASLVVHLVRRREAFFEPGKDGLNWADPVECLLDLHEARLEPQAREFLASFPPAKGQS